jgi:hypothetical protein
MGRSHASLLLILNEETIGTHSTEQQTGGMNRAQRPLYKHRIIPMGEVSTSAQNARFQLPVLNNSEHRQQLSDQEPLHLNLKRDG